MKKLLIFIFAIVPVIATAQYRISENGKKFIKSYETCKLTAYWDSNGYSIGWGHHGSDVTKGMTITQKQADKYFNTDIKSVEASVNRLIKALPYDYKFSQGFIDGMCSLVYNCGEGGVQRSEFYNRLKNCRIKKGKMDVGDFNWTVAAVKTTRCSAKGHIKRRYAEHVMMLN